MPLENNTVHIARVVRAGLAVVLRKTNSSDDLSLLQAVNEYTQAELKRQQEEAKKLRLQVVSLTAQKLAVKRWLIVGTES